jgi:hypothetical protein
MKRATAVAAAVLMLAGGVHTTPSSATAPSQSPSVIDVSLHDVVAIAADDAWAVGDDGLASHWDGSSWTSRHLGGLHSPELNAIAAVSVEDAWVVGGVIVQDLFQGFASHWDGSAWHRVPVPGPTAEMILEDVTMAATDDAWAIGRYFGATPAGHKRGAILIHWNGAKWSRVATLPHTSFVAVTSPKSRRVLVFVQGHNGLLWLITGTNGVWRTVIIPTPSGERCAGGDIDAAPAVVVGTCESGGVRHPFVAERRSDGTWHLRSIPGRGSLSGVDLGDATWAIGGSGPAIERRAVILRRSHRGGWFRVAVPPGRGSLLGMDGRNFNDAWAVGWRRPRSHSLELPLALHWDGAAWSRVTVPLT